MSAGPIFVAFALLFGLLLAIRWRPSSWWAQELGRSYGMRATGPFGTPTRRDLVRGALYSFGAATGLVLLWLGASAVAQQFPNISRENWIAGIYSFGSFLLAAVAVLAGVGYLLRAVFWRPLPPETIAAIEAALAEQASHSGDTIGQPDRAEFNRDG